MGESQLSTYHSEDTTVSRSKWVVSTWRAVIAVWQTYPALAKHFEVASQDWSRVGSEHLKFQGLHSKLCSVNFIRNLSLMLDVLTNLSEMLQERDMTIPKADKLMKIYIKRNESLKTDQEFTLNKLRRLNNL
ncbi:unnamed protein product [Caretta caretta]